MKKHVLFFILFSSVNAVHATVTQHIPDVTLRQRTISTTLSGSIKHTITKQMLITSGSATITDALRASGLTQLHDASGTGTNSQIGMRGFGANASSNTLILFNGIPLTNPDLMPPDLNVLPIETINKIEIIAGSESVLYGDDAVGGVINILSDQSYDKSLRFQCDTGSYQLKDCHLRTANHYRDLNYQVGLLAKSINNYRIHNHYLDNTLTGSAQLKHEIDQFNFHYKFTHENMQYPGALTAQQVQQNRRQSNSSINFFADNNQLLTVSHERRLSEFWQLNNDLLISGMGGNGIMSSPFNQFRKSLYLKPSLRYQHENLEIRAGMNLNVDYYHLGSDFGLTDNSQKKGGVFFLAKHHLTDKLFFTIGARGAAQATRLITNITAYTLNRAFASTIGLEYQLSPQLAVYLRDAGSFRFPKAEENTAGHLPLRTQRGTSFEGGALFDNKVYVMNWNIYQLNLRDEIAFDPLQTPENPFGSNQNLPPTYRRGTSIELRFSPANKWRFDTQINLLDARFKSGTYAGNRIPLVSEFIARAGVLYRFKPDWQLYLEGIFTGNEYAANDNANISGIQGGYIIYNFNLRYQHDNLGLGFHANNLLNQYYYLYTVYQSGMNTEFFYPAPTRNFIITISYYFN